MGLGLGLGLGLGVRVRVSASGSSVSESARGSAQKWPRLSRQCGQLGTKAELR